MNWQNRAQEVIDLAAPYVKQAGVYTEDAARRLGKAYTKQKKRAERARRMERVSRTLGLVNNLLWLAVSVVTLLTVVKKVLDTNQD